MSVRRIVAKKITFYALLVANTWKLKEPYCHGLTRTKLKIQNLGKLKAMTNTLPVGSRFRKMMHGVLYVNVPINQS